MNGERLQRANVRAKGDETMAMNAEERATWHMLLDAAQQTDHGQASRKRLRDAAIRYANAVLNRADDKANERRMKTPVATK